MGARAAEKLGRRCALEWVSKAHPEQAYRLCLGLLASILMSASTIAAGWLMLSR